MAHPEVTRLIRDRFIALAVDATDKFFWSGEEEQRFLNGNFENFSVRTPEGKILRTMGTTFAQNYDKQLLHMLLSSLKEYRPGKPVEIKDSLDKGPPDGTVVVKVVAKVLGTYQPYTLDRLIQFKPEVKKLKPADQLAYVKEYDRYSRLFFSAKGRDHLWINKEEVAALTRGEFPKSLMTRIARSHLEDFTRGQAAYWPKKDQLRQLELTFKEGRLTGKVHLEDEKERRGFQADLLGFVEVKAGKLSRFDLVAKGQYWGTGGHTAPDLAPTGTFPLAIAFTLASGKDPADKVPPNSLLKITGWNGYFQTE